MIYFDNAASTKPDKDILEKYLEINEKFYANPSSLNTFSQNCNYLFQQSKNSILKCLNLQNYNIIFTSGASESNTLALIGYVLKNKNKGDHIIVSEVEHASILNAALYLKQYHNIKVSYLKIKNNGQYDEDQFINLMDDKTILVSLMLVNNEIGTIYNFNSIKKIISNYPKCKLHSDVVQALGKIDFDYSIFDMFTISGHKIHGLKGSGALIVKNNIQLQSLVLGGNQQIARSGTLDLANAMCLAMAVIKSIKELNNNLNIVKPIHDLIFNFLKNNGDLYEINSNFDGLPYIINFSFKTKKASVVCEALSLKDIMVTTVSACSSHVDSSSYVVKALNKPLDIYTNTIRLSFDKNNTLDEAQSFIETLSLLIKEIKDGR